MKIYRKYQLGYRKSRSIATLCIRQREDSASAIDVFIVCFINVFEQLHLLQVQPISLILWCKNCLMSSMLYQFLFRLTFKALICLSVYWRRGFGQHKLRMQRAIYHQRQDKRLSVSKGKSKIVLTFLNL